MKAPRMRHRERKRDREMPPLLKDRMPARNVRQPAVMHQRSRANARCQNEVDTLETVNEPSCAHARREPSSKRTRASRVEQPDIDDVFGVDACSPSSFIVSIAHFDIGDHIRIEAQT